MKHANSRSSFSLLLQRRERKPFKTCALKLFVSFLRVTTVRTILRYKPAWTEKYENVSKKDIFMFPFENWLQKKKLTVDLFLS